MATIAASFDLRRNSLNFLRLVFALMVIVSHTWPLGGYGSDPRIAGQELGTWAVCGFFAISGYLIANSRRHTSLSTFLVRRALRIYPGYVVCLLVVALGFAPLSVAMGAGSIQWQSDASYVFHNLLLKVFQDGIDNTLPNAPYGPAWNGSLWTLIYEFICYLGIGLLLSFSLRWHRTVVVAAFVVTAAVAAADSNPGATGTLSALAFLGSVFFAGSIIAIFADRIPLDWRLGVLSIAVATVGASLHATPWLGALPMAYACIWLGVALPFHRVGRTNDISYGVYIYAFPVQQIITMKLGSRGLPVGIAVALSILGTLPLAIASWFLVEKRALALKNTLGAGRKVGGPVVAPRRARGGRHRVSTALQGVDGSV
jgi:peptidoglycan/LPS O-acetylase OafA/YrhL